jgi:hypothetical protein
MTGGLAKSDNVCPITGCERRKDPWHLCCSKHWFKLPKLVRDRIWDLFRTEEGSEKHRAACLEALAELERLEKAA